MKWCRCGQRPPISGSDICNVCRKKMRKQAQAQGGDGPKREENSPNGAAAAVGLGCCGVVLIVGAVLGWLVRGLTGF